MKIIRLLLSGLFLIVALFIACDDSTEPKNDDDNNNTDAPVISALSKQETYPGYPLEITGNHFGDEQSTSYVEVNGKKATTYIKWTKTAIKIIIPADATSGKVVVKVGSLTSNAKDITLLSASTGDAPVIKAFDTDLPKPRTTVGIEGSNFGDTQGENFITLNGAVIEKITSWRDKKIVIEIPTGAVSGNVIVFVNGKSSAEKFLEIGEDKLYLEQVLIPAGSFMMGSEDELVAFNSPIHKVTISKPFYMSKYEISQANWVLLQSRIGFGHNSLNTGPQFPVERVSWINACKFCNALSEHEKFKPVYTISGINVTIDWSANGYRLPTEAEWEWAAKGGDTTNSKYGWNLSKQNANINRSAWHADNSDSETHEVGRKDANGYGLHDMLGNVMEWCWDWFDGDYYAECGQLITDPRGPANSDGTKVLRGGAYTDSGEKTTVTYRWSLAHEIEAEYYMGFRVVRNAW